MLSSVLPILLAFLPTIAFARPTLQYEIADQRPPLAHVSSAFNFSLFPDTFTSSLPLDYTVSDLPTWVSFNPESLTFAGTAASTDEGRSTVQVTASDSEG
jgi:axial budding pattern protein 2